MTHTSPPVSHSLATLPRGEGKAPPPQRRARQAEARDHQRPARRLRHAGRGDHHALRQQLQIELGTRVLPVGEEHLQGVAPLRQHRRGEIDVADRVDAGVLPKQRPVDVDEGVVVGAQQELHRRGRTQREVAGEDGRLERRLVIAAGAVRRVHGAVGIGQGDRAGPGLDHVAVERRIPPGDLMVGAEDVVDAKGPGRLGQAVRAQHAAVRHIRRRTVVIEVQVGVVQHLEIGRRQGGVHVAGVGGRAGHKHRGGGQTR